MEKRIKLPTWANRNQVMADYYQHYWGIPVYDERNLFEMLSLEIFQAGLRWQMVWQRRAAISSALANFEIPEVAAFDQADLIRLINDPAIIRNRAKIQAIINNAQVICRMHEEGLTLANLCWQLVDYRPVRLLPDQGGQLPRTSPLAKKLAQTMKQLGFKRVGSVTCFAFMCAVGIVDGRNYQ